MEFEVTIALPSVSNDAILYLDSLETDMPLFEHWIGELGDTVYFRSIALGTEYRGVDVAVSCFVLYFNKADEPTKVIKCGKCRDQELP